VRTRSVRRAGTAAATRSGPKVAPTSAARPPGKAPTTTPDGRYVIVRGRLWRAANPDLGAAVRADLTARLMAARRAVAAAKRGGSVRKLSQARKAVHSAKVALGERGAPWWTDGSPDYGRCLAKNTPYAAWYARRRRR